MSTGKSLFELQMGIRFGQLYSDEYKADPRTHKRLAHNALHLAKAAGKIAALAEAMDHDAGITREEWNAAHKTLADLVIVAIHTAQEMPMAPIDIGAAVRDRLIEKDCWRDPASGDSK